MANIENEQDQVDILKDLFDNNNFDQLVEVGEKLIIDNPEHLDMHNILALAYKNIGQRDKAEEVFFKIIKLNPRNPKISFIYSNCANLFYDVGKTEQAITFHKASLELNPANIASSIGIGLALSSAGRDEEAVKYLEIANAENEDNQHINAALANSYRKLTKFKKAAEAYSKSKDRLSESYKLECLYIGMESESDKEEFNNFLKHLNNNKKSDPLISCISSHSSIRFKKNDDCNFCKKPFNYIKKYNLFDKSDFNKDLIDEFLFDINRSGINQKAQALLNNGLQTSGNLFNLNYKSVKKMKNLLIENMHDYRGYFKKRDDDFIMSWPEKGKLFGWLISIKKGGNLDPHMHKEGWLSSSIYLKMPEKKNDEGNIKFSLDGAGYPTDGAKYPEKTLDLSLGDMVMFPSSIFHSTIPFSSNEERITLAFDLIPID